MGENGEKRRQVGEYFTTCKGRESGDGKWRPFFLMKMSSA
jgi:hypothetical protein